MYFKYDEELKGYYIYFPRCRSVIVECDVYFDKDVSLMWEKLCVRGRWKAWILIFQTQQSLKKPPHQHLKPMTWTHLQKPSKQCPYLPTSYCLRSSLNLTGIPSLDFLSTTPNSMDVASQEARRTEWPLLLKSTMDLRWAVWSLMILQKQICSVRLCTRQCLPSPRISHWLNLWSTDLSQISRSRPSKRNLTKLRNLVPGNLLKPQTTPTSSLAAGFSTISTTHKTESHDTRPISLPRVFARNSVLTTPIPSPQPFTQPHSKSYLL